MPTAKNGKVSINLKIDENVYRYWVDKACDMRITNISEFIRLMVKKGIDSVEKR